MKPLPKSAVVFAYHLMGVRGLATLLAHGVRVPLILTHQDDPKEAIFFESVAELARLEGIEWITPMTPNAPEVVARIRQIAPDFFFSFYYRNLLGDELLAIPGRGGYNLHGSLLPKYRGRAPVNWAVLHGETATGASLHRMIRQPDAGELVDQESVPILPNDTAQQVMGKVVCAGERVLHRCLPALLAGEARHQPLDLAQGSYCGGRRPEDGRIDWQRPAREIHNLIRAVAPPYPGAFFDCAGQRLRVLLSHYRGEPVRSSPLPRIYWEAGLCYADCCDGMRLHLRQLAVDDRLLDETGFCQLLGGPSILLNHDTTAEEEKRS